MIEIREFTYGDYDEGMALWLQTEGLTLRDADSREAVARSLARWPHPIVVEAGVAPWPGAMVLISHSDPNGANASPAHAPDKRVRRSFGVHSERAVGLTGQP